MTKNMNDDLVIILRVYSYCGDDTFLEVGGDHIKEHVGGSGSELLNSDGVMYAIIHIKDGRATSDWGYATVREARETAKRCHPNAKIILCD